MKLMKMNKTGKGLKREKELIFNLWFVVDDIAKCNIYFVKGRHYVASGSGIQKLDFLRSRALIDYHAARNLLTPDQSHSEIIFGPGDETSMAHREALPLMGGLAAIVEGALKALAKAEDLKLPAEPLVCITTLPIDNEANLTPRIDGQRHL